MRIAASHFGVQPDFRMSDFRAFQSVGLLLTSAPIVLSDHRFRPHSTLSSRTRPRLSRMGVRGVCVPNGVAGRGLLSYRPNRQSVPSTTSAIFAPAAHRTAGETTFNPRPSNNLAQPGFLFGAGDSLGYTSSPVLGMLTRRGGLVTPRGNRRPWLYIHRVDFSALSLHVRTGQTAQQQDGARITRIEKYFRVQISHS